MSTHEERDARSSAACFKRGTWTLEEDALLLSFVRKHGPCNWNTAHRLFPDLNRSGKSCRLRYYNQLRPTIRLRTSISPAEESLILKYYFIFGNQWSRIASMLPERTDSTVENIVNMRLNRTSARRQAASINLATMLASEHQESAFSFSSMNGALLEDYTNMPLLSSRYGEPASVPPSLMATSMGLQEPWICSALSSPSGALASDDKEAPMISDTTAGTGAGIIDHSPPSAAEDAFNRDSSCVNTLLISMQEACIRAFTTATQATQGLLRLSAAICRSLPMMKLALAFTMSVTSVTQRNKFWQMKIFQVPWSYTA